jgi:hypothetical protein
MLSVVRVFSFNLGPLFCLYTLLSFLDSPEAGPGLSLAQGQSTTPASSASPADAHSSQGMDPSAGMEQSVPPAPSARCTCFRVLHFACGHLNPQYLTNKTTFPRNQRAPRFLDMPDQVFYISSSRPFLLSDLLGSHRTCLAQTVTDGIYIFFSESCVFVLFVLFFFTVARLQGLCVTYGTAVARTRAVVYCMSQCKAALLWPTGR